MVRVLVAALFALPLVTHGLRSPAQDGGAAVPTAWESFELEDLVRATRESGERWNQFLDRPMLFCGVYRIPEGGTDGQSPHEQDEVYYVAKGRAVLEVDGERLPAGPGSILFVAARAEHRFVDVEEDLDVLVFFSRAPVETAVDGAK